MMYSISILSSIETITVKWLGESDASLMEK